jgi:N-terminal domain of anti-restriction factor ArdC
MNMKQLTEQQLAARDERRTHFRALVKQLAELTDEERAARLRGFGFIKLSTQAPYSPANSLLIAFQSANVARPTILGGFAEWLKKGRAVRKGEHGYMIWIPMGAKKQEVQAVDTSGALTTMLQEASDVRFFIGTVFDISQTEEKGE